MFGFYSVHSLSADRQPVPTPPSVHHAADKEPLFDVDTLIEPASVWRPQLGQRGMREPVLMVRRPQPYVAIPVEATLQEWDQVSALFDELRGWLSRQEVGTAGRPFYRYWVIGGPEVKFGL